MDIREYLFRGKRKEVGQFGIETDKEWVYGGYAKDCSGEYIYDPMRASRMVKVLPITVGQYTGKTDRNGTKVYDKDIIRIFGGPTAKDCIGVVIWCNHDQCYVVVEPVNPINENHHIMDFGNLGKPEYFEVLGNIYDNQSLLKEEA